MEYLVLHRSPIKKTRIQKTIIYMLPEQYDACVFSETPDWAFEERFLKLHPYLSDTCNKISNINKNIFMKTELSIFEPFGQTIQKLLNHLSIIKQLVLKIRLPENMNTLIPVFQTINRTHSLVHFRGENGCSMRIINNVKIPEIFELTYIRNDYMEDKKSNNPRRIFM
jgi:hypothetical protein